jgi:hypothetical protein
MSNDVTEPGALAAALEAAATAVRKGDTLGEAVKALKVPAAALGGCDAAAARGGALLRPVARRRGGGALLELLPVLDGDAVIVAAPEVDADEPRRAPPRPWGAKAGFGYHDDDDSESEEEESEGSDLSASESERGSSAEDEEESERSSGGGGAGSSIGDDAASTLETASVDADDKGKAEVAASAGGSERDGSGEDKEEDEEEEDDDDDDDEEEEDQPYPVAMKLQSRKAPSPPPRQAPPAAPAAAAPAAAAVVAAPPAAAVAAAAPAPSPPPVVTLPLRLAFLHSEVISISGRVGGPETAAVEGSLILKGSFAEPLPPALAEAGFPPAPLRVRLRAGAPLASLTYTPAVPAAGGAPPAATTLVPAPGAAVTPAASSPALVDVELTVPGRPPRGAAAGASAVSSSASSSQVFELGTLHYKLAPGFAPPQVVRAQASCKYTFVPALAPAAAPAAADQPATAEDGAQSQPPAQPATPQHQQQQVHRFTDVLLKAVVHPSVAGIAPGAQLLVQLPPPALKPPHSGGGAHAAAASPAPTKAAAYEAPQMRPSGQWNAQRAQILWAVTDASAAAAAAGGGADSAAAAAAAAANGPATTATHLVPGKPCEWKARVPVAHGLRLDDAASFAAIVALPLQVRLSLPGAALAPVVIEPITDGDGAATDAPLRLTLAGVATKAQSRLTALYR